MSNYYNRDGSPVQGTSDKEILLEWAKRFEDDESRRVASDTIGHFWVSTVFLGLDHSWGVGPPLIFETMVFDQNPDNDTNDLFCDRYSTEEEAIAGHNKVLADIANGTFTNYLDEPVDTTYEITEIPTLI